MGGIVLPEIFDADYVAHDKLRVVAREGIPIISVMEECRYRAGGNEFSREHLDLVAGAVAVDEGGFNSRIDQGYRELKSGAEPVA